MWCVGVPCVTPAKAQYQTEVEELILAVKYAPYFLSDGIIALQQNSRYYVPVLEMADLLDFVIEPELERGYVSGYFLAPENSFAIDLEHGYYEVRGERKDLPTLPAAENPYESGLTDLYILTDILNEIWPVKMAVDLQTLSLDLTSEEKLPFELRLERKEKRKIALSRQAITAPPVKDLPFIDNPYKLLGLPALDLQTSFSWSEKNESLTGTTTLNGVQEFAGMVADYTATVPYQDEGFKTPDSIRMRFTREATGDDRLILGLTKFQAGDVRVQHQDLIATGSSGRGVVLFSEATDSDREFDEITVEGIGQPGWEIEVYRNQELIDFGVVPDDGEYRFENVQLQVGNNQIRVVLYGPQGQIRETVESYRIGGSMVAPGETVYSFGAADADRKFFLLADEPRTQQHGIVANGYVAHGLNNAITLFGSATRIPTREGIKQYVTGGAITSAIGGLGQVQYYKDLGGGDGIDLRYAAQMLGLSLNLQTSYFRDFESNQVGFGAGARQWESDIRLNRSIKTPLGPFGLQLSGHHIEWEERVPASDIDTQITYSRSGIRLTNQTRSDFTDYVHTNSSGTFGATVRMRDWQLRSNLGYFIYPQADLGTVDAEIRYRGNSGFSGALSARHEFQTSSYGAGMQVGYDFDKVLASLDVNWLRDRGFEFLLRASTSLAPYGPEGDWIMSSDKLSQMEPLQAHLFLDYDGDLVFSEGDEPLQGAGVSIDGRGATGSKSNEDGYVLVENAGEGRVNVTVNEATLFDPYFKPAVKGYSTVVRQASIPYLSFPIIETGAIDGTVYRQSGDGISGMRVQLVNKDDEIIASEETAYDGFYTFEFVPPGTYRVRADPSYQVNVPPQTVTVTSEDLFAYGIDLTLLEQAEEVGAAIPPQGKEAATDSDGVAQKNITATENGTQKPAPLSEDGGFSAIVQRVRIGEHPGKARLVLELSDPITQWNVKEKAGSLILELPDTKWEAVSSWQTNDLNDVLQAFQTEALEGEIGVRLVITGKAPLAARDAQLLPPNELYGHRLYLDVYDH